MLRTFLIVVASTISLVAAACGCGSGIGAVPESGYNTEQVSYEPKLNPDATVLEIPLIHAPEDPEPRIALPEPHVWTKSMPIAFVGEVERFNTRQTGNPVHVEISPILSDGSLGQSKRKEVVARLKQRRGNLPYLINLKAPDKPGRYRVVIKTVGPSHDHENLEVFVEGDVEVQ